MKAGKFLKYLILAVIAINLMIVAVVLLGSAAPKPTPLPNPNGYDDFVQAGQTLNGDASGYAAMTRNQLVDLISKNADALKLLRTGLSRECRVPDNYSSNYVTSLMNQLASFKKSVMFLCAEGRQAELDGRTNDAAKIYLDGVRFGEESSRDGVVICKLVGIACEAISLKPLEALNQSLDAKQCAEVAHALEDIDAKAEPIEETFKQEKNWVRMTFGIRGQITELLTHKSLEAGRTNFIAKFQRNELHRRQVMLDFVARAYELEHGKRPVSAADLVPAYLKAMPKDSATGQDLAIKL
jgi:hypothetical protein